MSACECGQSSNDSLFRFRLHTGQGKSLRPLALTMATCSSTRRSRAGATPRGAGASERCAGGTPTSDAGAARAGARAHRLRCVANRASSTVSVPVVIVHHSVVALDAAAVPRDPMLGRRCNRAAVMSALLRKRGLLNLDLGLAHRSASATSSSTSPNASPTASAIAVITISNHSGGRSNMLFTAAFLRSARGRAAALPRRSRTT